MNKKKGIIALLMIASMLFTHTNSYWRGGWGVGYGVGFGLGGYYGPYWGGFGPYWGGYGPGFVYPGYWGSPYYNNRYNDIRDAEYRARQAERRAREAERRTREAERQTLRNEYRRIDSNNKSKTKDFS